MEPQSMSPAQRIDFVVGYDAEGWEVWRTFAVGNIVEGSDDRQYKVIGFTYRKTLMVAPHGEGHDPAIVSLEFAPQHLTHSHTPDGGWMHQDGLVIMR